METQQICRSYLCPIHSPVRTKFLEKACQDKISLRAYQVIKYYWNAHLRQCEIIYYTIGMHI